MIPNTPEKRQEIIENIKHNTRTNYFGLCLCCFEFHPLIPEFNFCKYCLCPDLKPSFTDVIFNASGIALFEKEK